jgi:hypothetical protein
MSKKIKCRISEDNLIWKDCPIEEAVHTIIKSCLDDGAPIETAAKLVADLINGETVSINDFSYELEFYK